MSETDFSPWLAMHTSIWDNPKTFVTARILSTSREHVVGMLLRLWHWSICRESPDVPLDAIALAEVMHWEKDAELLFKALTIKTTGLSPWLDTLDSHLVIHDWYDYVGAHIAKRDELRRQGRIRQAAYKSRHEIDITREPEPNITTNPLVTHQPAVSNASLTLQHNQTKNNINIKKKLVKEKSVEVTLPDWIPFETWEQYLEMRTSIRHPVTTNAVKLIINQLTKFKSQGQDVQKILEQSTMYSWQKLVPIQDRNGGQNGTNRRNPRQTTRLPDRNTGYTEPPPDPALAAAVRAAYPDGKPAQR